VGVGALILKALSGDITDNAAGMLVQRFLAPSQPPLVLQRAGASSDKVVTESSDKVVTECWKG
jgi:hypothetical protein